MLSPTNLINRREAANYLSISERKLDQLSAAKELCRVKIGASVRFEIAELDRFIDERKSV